MSSLRPLVVALTLFGVACAPLDDVAVRTRAPAGSGAPLRLTVFDVGQGSAAAVIAPSGCAALLDGGPTGSGARIRAWLRARGVTRVDFAVVSHYHADHIGGLDEVEQGTDGVPVTTVYDRGGSYASATFDQYAAQYAGRRATVLGGQTLSLCGEVAFAVEAVGGNGVSTSDENALSAVVKVSWQGFDALAGGDLTGSAPDIESTLAGGVGPLEAYLVHHHGSRYSSNAAFLAATTPLVSVISVGRSNSYGHPAPETLDRLAAVGTSVWQTEDPATATARGDVDITAEGGATFTVTQGAAGATFVRHGASDVDVTPPTAPTGLVASASAGRIDLAWAAATDDRAVVDYRVWRGGVVVATTTATAWADTGLGVDVTRTYAVTARDAAGNESPASTSATATTPCAATITSRAWNTRRKELTVRATCTRQPTATLRAYNGATLLGPLTWQPSLSAYQLVVKLAARPACVTVQADCGGSAQSCF